MVAHLAAAVPLVAGKNIMRIKIKVHPQAGEELVEETSDGLEVWTRQPADKGRANKDAERLVAIHFGLAKSLVQIVSGHTSRYKIVEVLK